MSCVLIRRCTGVHKIILDSICSHAVGVVDVDSPGYGVMLEDAVGYVNTENIMGTGNKMELEIVYSMDNESFAAMEKGTNAYKISQMKSWSHHTLCMGFTFFIVVCSLLPGGVDLILDLSTRYVFTTIRSLAGSMGIPHIGAVDSSFYELISQEVNVSLNFEPPSSTMLLAIREIVNKEGLSNVGIIYDETFGKSTEI